VQRLPQAAQHALVEHIAELLRQHLLQHAWDAPLAHIALELRLAAATVLLNIQVRNHHHPAKDAQRAVIALAPPRELVVVYYILEAQAPPHKVLEVNLFALLATHARLAREPILSALLEPTALLVQILVSNAILEPIALLLLQPLPQPV
jgi:hypothetical protein